MALAKYFEDLVEDTLDGRRWLFDTSEERDPASEWVAIQQQQSEAVRLLHSNGVVWDDREAFYTNEAISVRVDTTRPDLPVKICWRATRGKTPAIVTVPGGVSITASQVNSGDLSVVCGNYTKTYRVSFTRPHQLETLPDFSEQLAALIQNPPSWTQAIFDNFCNDMEGLLQGHQLPEDFGYGIREFYLGLYHERTGEPRFGERLDRAAALLRPFIGHSRLALLICGYQMYRINAFDHSLASMALKRIGRAARFFTDGVFSPSAVTPSPSNPTRKTIILISAADHAMMDAIEAMDQGDAASFWKHAEAIARSLSPHDYHGHSRFDYLRARVCIHTGDTRRAKDYCVNLAHSIVPSFRALAHQSR